MLEFANNYSGTYGTDLVIVAGDMNSSPGTPVYNTFSQLVDCLVDKFGAATSTMSSHHTWGQTTNTFTGPGGSQNDNHAARSVSGYFWCFSHYLLYYITIYLSLFSGSIIFSTGQDLVVE